MKPLKLTMQAFGSYGRKTEIDFTVPNQNLFLITGDTGAGKTTIFDALVFALYGEASSDNNRKDGTELQSQYAAYSVEPYVELCFREQYNGAEAVFTVRRVPRHVRVMRKGSGIREEKESVTLTMPDGQIANLSQKETDRRLEEIVGLTKSQFMQVAMIAQGEFMELLRADSNKKKEIFRKLFGTDIYQSITDELLRRCKEKRSRMSQIRTACQTEAGHIRLPKTGDGAPELEAVLHRFLSAEQLQVPLLEELLQRLGILCAALEEQRKTEEAQWRKASEARDSARDARNAGRALLAAYAQLEQAEQTLAQCRAEQEAAEQKERLIVQLQSAFELQSHYARLQDAEKLRLETEQKQKALREQLPQQETACKETEQLLREAEAKRGRELETYSAAAERVKKSLQLLEKLKQAQHLLERQEAAWNQSSAVLNARKTDLNKLLEQEQAWREQLQQIGQTERDFAIWEQQSGEAEALMTEAQEAGRTQREVSRQKELMEAAKQEYAAVREQYTRKSMDCLTMRNAFLDAQAGYLAKEKLRPGEPCPVCGALEHPHPCELTELHRTLTREAIEAAEKQAAALEKKQSEKASEARASEERLREMERNLGTMLGKLRQRMEKSLEQLPEEMTISQAASRIQMFRDTLERQGNQLRAQKDALRKVQDALVQAEEKEKRLRDQIEAAQSASEAANAAYMGGKAERETLLAQQDYATETEAKTALALAEAQKAKCEAEYQTASERAGKNRQNRDQTLALLERYRSELPSREETCRQRLAEYREKLDEEGMPEEKWKLLAESHEKPEIQILKKQAEAFRNTRAQAEGAEKTARDTIGNRPKPDLDALEEACNAAQALLDRLHDSMEETNNLCRSNRSAYDALEPQMEERSRVVKECTMLEGLYARLAGKVSGARMDLETFAQRYYLQRILAAANTRFRSMTAGQYELRMVAAEQAGDGKNRGLDLMVYSNVTGKEREIRTLSGGESFMAALSLALGMADQIQQSAASVHLDILFIDEGFGSLDDHARDQAVRVLQQMADGSKLVGIISHVSELKQQIEDQLVVKKSEEGSRVHWEIS